VTPVSAAAQLLSYVPGGAAGGLVGLLTGLLWWGNHTTHCPLGTGTPLTLDCVQTPMATFTSVESFGATTALVGAVAGIVLTWLHHAGSVTD
jgi:hypothetical protein